MKFQPRTFYSQILENIASVDPVKYGKSRNFINGAVTFLSPYISRGVISTKQVLESVLNRGYSIHSMETFVKELCWRDYFQRIGQVRDMNADLKFSQEKVMHHKLPSAIINATTAIKGIDLAITELYETGYMHNHCRMYVASLVCNIAQSHWYLPSRWMYYHLLDGDFATNAGSWQWVAGSGSSKKYYANQENINRYTFTHQAGTYLDCTYEALAEMNVPEQLTEAQDLILQTELPSGNQIVIDPNSPTFIYNYYNLDPLWHGNEKGNRILLLEPEHFQQYPVSKKCIDFMLGLSANIPDLQIYIGSFQSLQTNYQHQSIYFKEHPLNKGYNGIEESRDWICEEVSGYYPSFFSYWKKIERQLAKKYKHSNA